MQTDVLHPQCVYGTEEKLYKPYDSATTRKIGEKCQGNRLLVE
jgi:hypothetical protein